MSTDKTEAAAWISTKAKWTKPADSADPFVVRVAVGYAGAEIMGSNGRRWRSEIDRLKHYAAMFGMDDADVSVAIDRAAATT